MTCRDVIEFLGEYLAGELPAGQRATFEEHLVRCPACVNYLAGYRTTVALGQAALRATDVAVPPEVPAALIEAVLAARRKAQG